MGTQNELKGSIVELGTGDGVAFIEAASPLTRLHYFDGKFLRADAFALEQDYHRSRTRLANLAGGWGVVHGLGIALAGNQLKVSAGLAITAAGNFVLATGDMEAALAELLEVATPAPLGGNPEFADCTKPADTFSESAGLTIYEITAGPVEGLCGNEAVFGKLCESACVSSSQRPYWREGVVLRLRPISLKLPTSAIALGSVHLRNRVASAYFAAEPWLAASALSSAGLGSSIWCNPATLYGRDEVVIGLLAREGGVNRVLDAWSGRRERMDSQARGYWQGRMAMRPWNVFVAQVLQFQCQLAGLFDGSGGVIKPADDCAELRQLLDRTRKEIAALHTRYGEGAQKILKQFSDRPTKKEAQGIADDIRLSYADLYEISEKLATAELGSGALPKNRLLLNAGFVELPPAGYLPVIPGKQALDTQLARMFGEGVRLHYHAVRHDEIAHLVEEAQHLERISLTRGLDDPKQLEDVEIFVPDGEPFGMVAAAAGTWWQVEMSLAVLNALDLGLDAEARTDEAATVAAGVRINTNMEEMAVRAANTTTGSAAAATGAATDAAAAAAANASVNIAGTPMNVTVNATTAATAAELMEKLRQLMLEVRSRPLRGLARTESREDGSHGFTLVATLELDDIIAQMQKIVAANPGLDPNGTLDKQLDAFAGAAIYLAGDIARDPFDLAVGQDTALKGELRFGKAQVEVSGDLTVQFDRPTSSGFAERVVGLRLVAATADGKLTRSTGQISLARKGDSANGRYVIDDATHDPSTSPSIFEWQDVPRTAAMYVLAEESKEAFALRYIRGLSAGAADTSSGSSFSNAASLAAGQPASGGARTRLLKMDGLEGMPAPSSTLGAAAINALIRIADTADDAAFLVRARRRLFPTLEMQQTEGVRAVLDWVMFRRARTHLCCPQIPVTPVKPALEAFQVWHIGVADEAALKELQAALDRNDGAALARFPFQRVGVLRYRDENVVSEEPESQVQAMWRLANPGNQVVLGRYWEQTPSTGQGWQNHFRLRTMLAQIAAITQPPARGDGAIAGLAAVSPPLSDGALDGGLLVVTRNADTDTEVVTHGHQVVFTDEKSFVTLHRRLTGTSADDALGQLNLELLQGAHRATVVHFDNGTLRPQSEADIKSFDAAMRQAGVAYTILALHFDAPTARPGEDLAAQHDAVTQVLNVSSGNKAGGFTASTFDTRNGFHSITLLGYRPG